MTDQLTSRRPCRAAGVLLRLGGVQPVLLGLPVLPQLDQLPHHVRGDAAGGDGALLCAAGARTAGPAAEGRWTLPCRRCGDGTGSGGW